MPRDFGTFAPVFETAHCYLDLLDLCAEGGADAVRLVCQCAVADINRDSILALLADLNWRPTLVAAVAAAFLPPDPRITEAALASHRHWELGGPSDCGDPLHD